jgi:formamidase
MVSPTTRILADATFLEASVVGVAGIADTTASRTREHVSRSDQKLAAEWGGRMQADAICSVAVDLKVGELADVPNFVVSAFLPLDVFG